MGHNDINSPTNNEMTPGSEMPVKEDCKAEIKVIMDRCPATCEVKSKWVEEKCPVEPVGMSA
jgi:hypothetical protein